ncbi:hypothetical protein [Shewanella sp. NIFS-20-20]|uniref:hypothetical protein n=1 Tax=Shewanella sp. NIFS-20-20 TaxID=2853806 RepID=UPI001C4703D9|nr:hypothetical protein [Shewanella sp. NIFS-20-20]MBV7315409.1 hypothetical protein [Shewanella sp. NIFS-20-20]
MTTAIVYWVAACALCVSLAVGLAAQQLALPELAVLLAVLVFMPGAGVAAAYLILGLWIYLSTLSGQSLEMSLSVWIMVPVIIQALDKQRLWQFRALLVAMACSLFFGLVVLQAEGRLAGEASLTLWQIVALVLICFSGHRWKPSTPANAWLLLPAMILLGLGQWLALAIVVKLVLLIYCLQQLKSLPVPHFLPAISLAMPIAVFGGLSAMLNGQISAPTLLAWLLTLVFVWLGDRVYPQEQTEE